MICTNCGAEFAVGKFCPQCGTPAPSTAYTQNSLATPVEPTPEYTQPPVSQPEPTLYEPSYAPQGSYEPSYRPQPAPQTYEPSYRPQPAPQTYEPTHRPAPAPRKPVAPQKKKRSILPAIIALVLIAALVVGALVVIKTGPINSIVTAAKKTLDSGSFTAEMTITADGETGDLLIMVEFDPEEEIFNYLIEMDVPGNKQVSGMYDGVAFSKTTYGDESYYNYYEVDMDELFEGYLEYADEVGNIFDPYSLPSDKEDILFLLEELDDATDGMLSDVMDLEILADCIADYQSAHNDKGWLKENAGFTQSKEDGATVYTYEPNLYEFLDASLPFFEEAFEDSDDYEEGADFIEDGRSELKKIDLLLSIGVKSGKLAFVELESGEVTIEIQFYNIGKTELDAGELEDLAKECEEGYNDYYSDYEYYD